MTTEATPSASDAADAHPTSAGAEWRARAEETRRRIRQIPVLPALPKTLALVPHTAALPQDFKSLAAVVSRDPVLAARVLGHANKESGAGGRATGNLDEASEWVGTRGISRHVSEAVSEAILREQHADVVDIQRRSIVAAIAARCIAKFVGHRASEELYCAALLHGLGRLALEAAYPEQYQSGTQGQSPDAREAAERAAFGLAESEAGLLLAQAWHLPPMAADCIHRHHNVSSGDAGMPVLIVALAAELAQVFQSRDKEQCRRSAARCQQLCKPLIIPQSRLVELMKTIRIAVETDEKLEEQLRYDLETLPKGANTPRVEPGDVDTVLLTNQPETTSESPRIPSAEPTVIERPVPPVQPAGPEPERVYHRVMSTNRRVDGGAATPEDGAVRPQPQKLQPVESELDADAPLGERIGALRGNLRWLAAGAVGCVGLMFCILEFRGPSAPSEGNSAGNALGAAVVKLPAGDGSTTISLDEAIAFVGAHPVAPETAGYLNAIGDYLYDRAKDYAQAATYYRRLVDDYPAWGGTRFVYLRLADCYERLGQPDTAMETYRKVIAAFPEDAPEYGVAKAKLEAPRPAAN